MTGKTPSTLAKPCLLVVLGAGASMDLRIPSTEELTGVILKDLRRKVAGYDDSGKFVDAIVDNRAFSANPTFERFLHILETINSLTQGIAIEGHLYDGPHSTLRELMDLNSPCVWPTFATTALLESIYRQISKANKSVQKESAWNDLSVFFQQLNSTFELYIATTNYDTVVEQALGWGAKEQGFEPISGGKSTMQFCQHRNAPRLLHLHGSIHFGYRRWSPRSYFRFDEEYPQDLYWHSLPDKALETWVHNYGGNDRSQAGRDIIIGPFITGLQKPDKLLAEPYMSYFRHFGNLAATTPRLLVVGYGFGDKHINATLARLARWHRSDRRIAVVGYLSENKVHSQLMDTGEDGLLMHLRRWCERKTSQDCAPEIANCYPNPWPAKGSGGHAYVRFYPCGFRLSVQRYRDDILQFLAS